MDVVFRFKCLEDGKKPVDVVTGGLIRTLYAVPYYNGDTLDEADALAKEGRLREAVRRLFAGPSAPRSNGGSQAHPKRLGKPGSQDLSTTKAGTKEKYAKDEAVSDEENRS